MFDAASGAQSTGGRIVAELTGKLGWAGGTLGGEMDLDCFNTTGYAKAQFGFTRAAIDTNGSPDFGYVQNSYEAPKLGGKVEGKLALKQCAKF